MLKEHFLYSFNEVRDKESRMTEENIVCKPEPSAESNQEKEKVKWNVYCIATVNEPTYTYIGATPYPDQRLRQHNGEIKGGAKATSKRNGEWYRVCLVKGFTDNCDALSFEWHWKHFSRKYKTMRNALERRKIALDDCLLWYYQKHGDNPVSLEVDWT